MTNWVRNLIEQSGADFDAPIINLAPDVARSATKAAEQGRKKSRKRADKQKRGTVRDDTLSRLTTSKGKVGDRKRAKSSPDRGRKTKVETGRGTSRSGKPKQNK